MADPKTTNGHIDIANEIADKLCSYRLNGQEWQILWVILRKTWGWLENPKDKKSPKKKMDRIALSQFTKLTGINRSRCHTILKGLLDKQIIKKTVTQKCNSLLISYGIQSNFDLWKVLPKSATVTQKCNGVLPKSATKVLPKSATTKDTITKDTNTKDTNTVPFEEIILYLNEKSGKKFRPTANETKRVITARWNQGYKLEDFQQVIDNKCGKWLIDPKMIDYIRPQTLFGTKFESYLNETPIGKNPLSQPQPLTKEDIDKLNE